MLIYETGILYEYYNCDFTCFVGQETAGRICLLQCGNNVMYSLEAVNRYIHIFCEILW